MAFRRNDHPEMQDGEVFTGNTWETHFKTIGWTTKRMGNTAYDENDNPIDPSLKKVPVFVQRDEITAKGLDPDKLTIK